MFGILRRKRPIVHAHWITPLLDFSSDADEFYKSVQEDLRLREVPELVSERIQYKDGGFLSQGREYLRLRRELLIFDILSAKFGTSWWFSCRSSVIPRSIGLWDFLLALLMMGGFAAAYWYMFGLFVGSIVMGATLGMMLILMVAAKSWNGLDDLLLQLPVAGIFYEAIFRAESYYRDDSRRMYVSIVDYVVREKVKEFATAGGIEEVPFNSVSDSSQLTSLLERIRGFVSLVADAATPGKRK